MKHDAANGRHDDMYNCMHVLPKVSPSPQVKKDNQVVITEENDVVTSELLYWDKFVEGRADPAKPTWQ